MAKKKAGTKAVKKAATRTTTAPKKATKGSQSQGAKKKYVVPGDCGPLADLIMEKLKDGQANKAIGDDFKSDYIEGATFLEDIPDNATFADFDLLTEHTWSKEAEATIRKS